MDTWTVVNSRERLREVLGRCAVYLQEANGTRWAAQVTGWRNPFLAVVTDLGHSVEISDAALVRCWQDRTGNCVIVQA